MKLIVSSRAYSIEGKWPYKKQIEKIMKLTTLLLLIGVLQAGARTNAQKVTIESRQISLRQALNTIQQQTGYSFIVAKNILDKVDDLHLHLRSVSIGEALDACMSGLPYSYTIEGKIITLLNKSTLPIIALRNGDPNSEIVFPDIHGRVTDSAGNAIGNVNVTIKGTHIGTITDDNGVFLLKNVDDKEAILIFSHVGYNAQEIPLRSRTKIDVVLRSLVQDLEEVVEIGYGAARKKDLTGSIGTVDVNTIKNVPFLTVDNALAGKVAGVQVTKTDGTPGGAVRIQVRGTTSLLGGNTPLYVIDGVPIQVQSNYINPGFDVTTPQANAVNSGLSGISVGMQTAYTNGLNSIGGLNIDDIESISVLKDASASAIYGSKASNGVVIINTKRGKKNMKPQVSFSNNVTYSVPILPHQLNANQYISLLTEAARNDSLVRAAANKSQNSTVKQILTPGYFGNANTDWTKLVTRNVLSENGQIALQGGSNYSRYYTSLAYNTSPGVIKGSTYKRISGKINLENEIGNHLRFLTNVDIATISQNITNGVYSTALSARPDMSPYDASGNFTSFASLGYSYMGFQNPVAMLTATNNSQTFSLIGSLSGIYHFNNELEFKSAVSLNMQTYNQRNYTPSYLTVGSSFTYNSNGIGSNSNSRMNNWFVENTLTYNKIFGTRHSINALIGTSYQSDKTSYFTATAAGYPNDNILNNLSSAVTLLRAQGDDPSKPQSYMVSYFLRINYGYLYKYLLTFTGRSDGSSKFGPENKYGVFPSAAIAWRISKESFMKNIAWVDDLKIRASYGITGTQNIGNQMYRTLFTPYSYNGSNAVIPTQLGNPGIKWETTNQSDIGLDFSFFDQRLEGTFDYYKKQINNALINMPIAPSGVYGSMLANVAGIRNSGYEASVSGILLRTKDFQWKSSLNVTWNKSIVTKLSKDAILNKIGNYSGVEVNNTALIEGQPLGLITGSYVTGIIRTNEQLTTYKSKLNLFQSYYPYLGIGDPMLQLDTITYASYNSGYPMTNAIIGHGAPKYYGGITQEFSYKNFGMNFYFTFSQGGQLLWGNGANSLAFVGTANANETMLNRWTATNTNSTQPRLLYGDGSVGSTNLSVYNSSYLKLRTVTFNYQLKTSPWIKQRGIQAVLFFVSANNVFTLTSYPGLDPEVSDDPYSVGGGYVDVGNIPSIKSYSIGVKITF